MERPAFAIIAAGEGSRLVAEGIAMPKPLIPINGMPMIGRLIRLASGIGSEKIWCIANAEAVDLHRYLTGTEFGIEVDLTIQSTPSSLHSLQVLTRKIGKRPFFLSTTDTVFLEGEFLSFAKFVSGREPDECTLAVTGFIDDEKPLCVSMDASRRITGFSDSPQGCQWATGGLYHLSAIAAGMVDEVVTSGVSRLRNYLKQLLQTGHILNAFPFGKMIDVDHVTDIYKAEALLLNEV